LIALSLLIATPAFSQDVRVCIGSKVVYAANGMVGSVFDYRLEPAAGDIFQTHNDSIIVTWGAAKGVFQLGVRETTIFGCIGDWAFLNVEVIGEYAQFAQPVYSICGNGGVIIDFNKSDFQAYNWVDESVSASGYITKPGIYELITIDHNNCRLSNFIEVIQDPIQVSLGSDIMVCETNFTLHALNTENNHPETVYTWSNGESGISLKQISVSLDIMEDAKYWVRAEHDGCVTSDTITIRACVLPNTPNTFTPNDDGENDVWNIEALIDFPECSVEVFDRWGRRVFVSPRGYPVPWDGRDANGNILPMETYYYIIHLNDRRFREPLTGTITIIR